ncbi:four helix bundle protein [Olivibacter jilunii]|uniref:four helix bundle protein n=1 Tax=Olivibacter jilunii TaxID=985016 RepID=UPI003F13F7AE
MRDFKKYDVWQLGHDLAIKVYRSTIGLPVEEKYGITAQMRRAAYSIPSNFAEGCGRIGDKEFNRFIQISLGSAHELEYFVILSRDLLLLGKDICDELEQDINLIKKKLYSLTLKLKKDA